VTSIELRAASLEEGRQKAADLLKIPPEEVELTITSKEKKGPFGMGGEVLVLSAQRKTAQAAGTIADGAFAFFYQRGSFYLTVTPPSGGGKRVRLEDIEKEMESWPAKLKDMDLVKEVAQKSTGEPVEIAIVDPALLTDKVLVMVSEDGMTAHVLPGNVDERTPPLTANDVRQALAKAGVTFGIREQVLESLQREPLVTPRVIALGEYPVDGEDAVIEYTYDDPNRPPTPQELEDGRVDYRNLGRDFTVEAGQVLVRKKPATPGKPGHAVTGREIPAQPGKDVSLKALAGQNTKLNETETEISAAKPGLPMRTGDKVAVLPVLTISGDVDFSTGNINFDGNLVIRGNVNPGFTVKATGNIQVMGVVDSAFLEAGGNLLLTGGVHGHGVATLYAKGNINARFLSEVANIACYGDLVCNGEMVRCTVVCGNRVLATGKGRIMGGHIRARQVIAGAIGSLHGLPTIIQATFVRVDEGDDPAKKKPLTPFVGVQNEVFPGTVISVNGIRHVVHDATRSVRFQQGVGPDNQDIVEIVPYSVKG